MEAVRTTGASPPAPLGERRQVSVLFVDAVGYTAIAEQLGEERTVAFVRALYQIMAGAVREHGGVVRGFAGDGLMALFGIPDAYEDSALRACRAAAAIHAAIAQATDGIAARFGVRPMLRVGVSSGVVAMAAVEDDDTSVSAIGDTVNLASRLEALAPPGGTMICETTQRLVAWYAETSFDGEHRIKGKSQPQKLWRLDAVRNGLTRFDASLGRGLSPFVGREAELGVLQDARRQARDGLRVIDLVAEPGLGKTRLVYEFQRRLAAGEARVLTGHCSTDGRNIPFLPFLELTRSVCGIEPEDSQAVIAAKLDAALRAHGMGTAENLGLLMNLLGLSPPDGALAGLDGVLIGLRTRDLLPALLTARGEASMVVLLFEDIHWIDSASEGILATLVGSRAQANLLVIATRRPEYVPPWRDGAGVTTIALKPLHAGDIGHLLQSRLGVAALPDALAREVTERAAGNPLFGEELLGFLLDQGSLRVDAGRADFAGTMPGGGLPASLQGLLATRTDRLPPEDRMLLQAAATIGRRFDPSLLGLVVGTGEAVGAALERLQAQDIVHRAAGSTDYVFKHVLLSDSVYQSLLSDRRAALHLKVAEALERRSEGRLAEVAETLAHHYAKTDRHGPAFTYLAMAGAKALGAFSLDEADRYFAAALALHERNRGCASDEQFAEMLARYALCANISLRVKTMIDLAARFGSELQRIGDSHHRVRFLHHHVASLVWAARFDDALSTQQELSAMAARLGDRQAMAYALVSEMSVATYRNPNSIERHEALRQETEAALATVSDPHLHNYYFAVLAWDQVYRGRVTQARQAIARLEQVGAAMADPRSLGYATSIDALLSVVSDDYAAGLEKAELGLRIARAPFEMICATTARNSALVLLNRPGAIEEVERHLAMCQENGWINFTAGPDSLLGIALAMKGQLGDGLRRMEEAIARREAEGLRAAADWARMFLCEVYLDILAPKGSASLGVLLRNIGTLARVFVFGPKRIEQMLRSVRSNPQFDREGHFMGRAEMILGLLHKAKKNRARAAEHLAAARRILSAFGPSPMLSRVEAAFTEVAGPER